MSYRIILRMPELRGDSPLILRFDSYDDACVAWDRAVDACLPGNTCEFVDVEKQHTLAQFTRGGCDNWEGLL